MMNFIYWLLQRLKRKLFSSIKWQWVEKYRRMILFEKAMSIVITFLLGMIFTGCVALGALTSGCPRELVSQIIDWTASAIIAFYLYHWLAALYEVYTTEKMATWHALKDE
jgi:hypothetical protein